jgi:hypothetical protein
MMIAGLVAAIALVTAGCGGGDEDGTTTQATTATSTGTTDQTGAKPSEPSDEQQIRTTVEKLLTSTDPGQVCEALVTPTYVKDSFGSVKGCERAAVPGSAARSAEVSRIEVMPGGASAKAVPKGGPSAGETLTVTLSFASGGWKVDRLRSNAPVGP